MPRGTHVKLPEALQGRFAKERVLGKGGFGWVVLARDLELDRRVAIKLLKPEGADSPAFRARFEREARLAAGIRSPYVAAVYDSGIAGDVPYIVSEYIDGPSLRAAIRQGPGGRLPPDFATQRLREILEGLRALHADGVVHRDLKPENVMLRKSDEAVLIDLGLGRGEQDTTLTKTGLVVGSPMYMPPQQMTVSYPSPSWDVYAAAAVYLEMLTGRYPFRRGATYPELHELKLAGPPEGLRSRGIMIPLSLDALVIASLGPEDSGRPADGAAFLEALDAALAGNKDAGVAREEASRNLPAAAVPVGEGGDQSRRRPPGFAIGIAAGLLVGVAAASAFLLLGQGSRVTRGAPPPTGLDPAPVASPGDVVAGFRRVLDQIEGTPAIQEATALTNSRSRQQALEVWSQARATLVTLARELDLRGAVDLALAAPLDPEAYSAAARISLYERLLSATTFPDVPPLWRAGTDPGLARYLDRGLVTGPEPSMSGQTHGDTAAFRRRYRATLARGGRSWKPLRVFEDLAVPGHPEAGTVDNVRIHNLNGDPYRSLMENRTMDFAEGLYESEEWKRREHTPSEVELDLEPVEGDLVLAMCVHGWGPTTHMELVLRGREATTRAVFTPPPLVGPGKMRRPDGTFENIRQGLLLRLRREILPARVRTLTILLRGLQPLGSPKSYREIQEIYQLVEGPSPEVLAPP